MGQIQDTAIVYFRAAKNYFWRWAEEGQVIEWTDGGGTICYKEELLIDLFRIKNHLPPLGPFLLVIASGKASPGSDMIEASLHRYVESLYSDLLGGKGPFEYRVEKYKMVITNFLDLLRPLPREYWKGTRRELLLNTLFESIETFFQGDTAKEMLNILDRGAYDYVIAHDNYKDTTAQLETDTRILTQILHQYPDAETLQNKLNTIATPIPPAPAPVDIPPDLPKPAQGDDLLQILADDKQTAHLALLTQRLIAALHLPMHTKGYSETLVGGVSDITNKGNFDRLLLSELAQEDETLMARLANNEALYLRREELPDDEPGQRFILIDKSIKTWGTPHILEMAAALACAIDNKQKAEILSFALLGDTYEPIILSSKEEIIAAMQRLSPVLHSGAALSAFTNDYSLKGRQEYFLITGDDLFLTPAFQHAFATLRKTDGFVITVNRDGRMQLYRYTAGHRKLLSTAKINLEMLVAPKLRPQPVQQKLDWASFPAFLQTESFPLFIPQQLSNLAERHSYSEKEAGGLAITKHRQLLFMWQRGKGAIEITANFPDAHQYFFGLDNEFFHILFQVKGSEHLSLCHFNRNTHRLTSQKVKHNASIPAIGRKSIIHAPFKDGAFLTCISSPYTIVSIDVRSGVMNSTTGLTQEMLKKMDQETGMNLMSTHWKSYNTINSIKRLEITQNGTIIVNKHTIRFLTNSVELSYTNDITLRRSMHDKKELIELPDIKKNISRYCWPDGSEVWFDQYRHMLHLRSSNKLLAEVTIVLVIGQPTGCWASDGAICGSPYFRASEDKVVDVLTFHEKYIKPFIDIIQQHGTAAVI
ncbi:hypothetical protein [Chitinophaga sp. S165]|uniref:hypothetical protein n=1 Tax=Chitinophaga sp. S165 TaxID=2135462 RepID=UPI000D70ED05|nr:hypothetical protein [Chitinophaga sp. S165]PWV51444.1 hypothetical protein C7475_10353 [Chitinophaga sp. S165]